MRLRRSFRLSLRALFAHRTRAMLALASVAAGVAAVLLTSAIGTGAQREIVKKIETMGTNLLIVRPAQVERLASRRTIRGVVTTLLAEDAEAIGRLPAVLDVAPGVDRPVRVKAGPYASMTKVLGTTPAFPRIRNFRVARGRFFDGPDELQRVAVLARARRKRSFRPAARSVPRSACAACRSKSSACWRRKASRRTAATRTTRSSSRSGPRCAACSTRGGSPRSS